MALAGARVAGAHRASDRGAAQEHPRLRARDRAAPCVARPHAAHAGGDCGVGARPASRGALAVADGHAAPVQARRARRDRERPRLLPLYVPRRGAAPAGRACAGPARHLRRRHRRAAVPAHGLVDRRRPRRQSLRHGGDARLRDPRAGLRRVRALPRCRASAGRRAFAVGAPRPPDRPAARARSLGARHQSASRRRAVPPGAGRRLRTARRDRGRADRAFAGGVRRTPRRPRTARLPNSWPTSRRSATRSPRTMPRCFRPAA